LCEPARDTSGGFSQRPGPPRRPPKEAGDIIYGDRSFVGRGYGHVNLPRTICVQACTTRTETDPGADKGGLQTAGSLRAVRHTSGRFSRRPGPSLRPPKEAGDIVSAHNLRRRLHHTHKMDSRARAGVRGGAAHRRILTGCSAHLWRVQPAAGPAPPAASERGGEARFA
jgi:hypothetical protein